ncbi:hypothetical protein EDB85DRAFT_1936206 [Lactarius pseudohatsudake]|nr:hypothetical protein EDB85DRAFT_1936206 [Lactarius pseudohatsudake]
MKSSERKVPEHTALTAPPSWHQFSDYRWNFILGPHSLLIGSPCACRTPQISPTFLVTPQRSPSSSYFWTFSFRSMTIDTVIDLRQRAGELAQRLGSLGHFLSAAHELLDIIRHLSSENLLQHSRKIVTLVEISRATLTRAGLKLHLFTSCAPALRNYKTLYFDLLRALRERQEVIVNSDDLKDRVNRLLMPLSTWLVIHRKDSPSMVPSSVPVSPNVDTMTSPSTEASKVRTISVNRPSATAHPVPAPEELMPPPMSLPHRFQQSPSTSPRGLPLILQPDPNQRSGVIRMARTRSPRPVPLVEPELMEQPPEQPPASPVVVPRRTQRFGIFCTGPSGSGARRRGLSVPRSGP